MPRGPVRLQDEEERGPGAPAPVSEPEPALLELQRTAGNHAVAQMLARDFTFSPLRPAANPLDPGAAAQSVLADHNAATQAIWDWFDKFSEPHRESGSVPGSVPELVAQAVALPFTLKDGSQGVVRDKVPPPEAEEHVRLRARTLGLRLQEHRDASDVAGVRSELSAVLANLGAIPTQLTLGDDDAKVVASLSGKITGELKVGRGKVDVEGSSEGVEGSVEVPGAKFGLEVGGKGIKAEVKAGELIHNLDDPAKVKEHGAALASAVSDAVEKAKKSAAQKPGWRVGAELKGDSAGGFSGSITFTWVF